MSDADKTARNVTDIIIDNMETKIHAGEWVRIDTVRRALHEVIAYYETQLEDLKRMSGEEE
tara:strand:- start:10101 stop:10283 length:183 start_codon:yes stop_codon:yes gene_type:complete